MNKKLTPQVPGEHAAPAPKGPAPDPTPEEQAAAQQAETEDVGAMKAELQRLRVKFQEFGDNDPTAHLPTQDEAKKSIDEVIARGDKPRAVLSKKGWVVPPGEKPKVM